MDFWISFANFFASAIRLTAPIALGTLACTISERAGVINIGIEGTMLFSGFCAAVGTYYIGSPWVGLLCGCMAGALLAVILGLLAIYCNGQHIVIGIGLNLFGPGFAYMMMRSLWDTTGISPWIAGFQTLTIPGIASIPVLGTMLSGYPACVYLGFLAVAIIHHPELNNINAHRSDGHLYYSYHIHLSTVLYTIIVILTTIVNIIITF